MLGDTHRERTHDQILHKGQVLYQRCLSKGDRDCVEAFVAHELARHPHDVAALEEYLAWLHAQRGGLLRQRRSALSFSGRVAVEQQLALTNGLISNIIYQLYGLHEADFGLGEQ